MSSELSSNPNAVAAGSPAPGGMPAGAAPGGAVAKPPAGGAAKGAWSPLAVPAFRALWTAYLVSLIGTWAREAGGPWLMRALKEGHPDAPTWVSLIQTAGTLPICFLSIAAGVLADIYDRRNLLILTNVWMLVVSALLGAVTLAGWASPQVLLGFTFLLGVGAALSGPAFQYVIPELVPPGELPLAIALNSVALNVARAVGPVIGMLIVIAVTPLAGKVPGIGASFLVNAAAFVGVIWVLLRWRRAEPQKRPPHPETLWGATVTAVRYTAHSAALLAILVRVAGFILCAVVIWAQLPIIARQLLKGDETTYLFLMGAVGVGAVVGVMFMPKMDKRFSTEGMVAICTIAFGLAVMAVSQCTGRLWLLAFPMMMVVGFNWVIVPTNFNIATQRSTAGWVKGRAIAMYMTVLFGSFAVGSPIWGSVTSRIGISASLLAAGALVALGALLAIPFPLNRARGQDFSPAGRPAPANDAGVVGPFKMVVEYRAAADRSAELLALLQCDVRRQRLRNGAAAWQVAHADAENGDALYEESFAFGSWADRVRFEARTTKADAAVEERARGMTVGGAGPAVSYRPRAAMSGAAASVPAASVVHAGPRKVAYPPPLVDWNRFGTRVEEEFDAVWNRVIRAKFRDRRRA